MKRYILFVLIILFAIIATTQIAHSRTLAEIEAEVQLLEAEAETASLTRQMEIVGRLQQLAQEAMEAGFQQMGTTPVADILTAASPVE